ncbi:RNA-binding protein NOB1 [Anoplophora glabripennis]|nr:RNA-binding protein NOB1 [Anoplophora glabripennis]
MGSTSKSVDYLVVDTTAFIQNVPLQEIAENIITCPEVVTEITNKRQLRRLVVLPYDLVVRDVFPENIKIVTDFSKKTGDYPSLSITDIKVMALTYQLEKEKVGINHLRTEPVMQKPVVSTILNSLPDMTPDVTGFVLPGDLKINFNGNKNQANEDLAAQFKSLECTDENLSEAKTGNNDLSKNKNVEGFTEDDTDDEGWITPLNVEIAKKQINSELTDDNHVAVACMTTDFAMQNVLRQMNLNVASLDGRIIKQLRTYILRCYTCFKTTSIMTKKFCPKCGNNTLKKVAASLDENGKLQIHINVKRPLTARGKKFSLPKIKGGKHPNNPILVEDQPIPDNKPSRLARTKNNPLDDDYIAGYSPFVMRDINSKSAQLCIRPGQEYKNWLRKNPNEARRKRK